MATTKYGERELAVFTAMFVAFLILLILYAILTEIWTVLFAVVPVIGILFVFYFFRDPQRVIPEEKNLILAPADGKVTELCLTQEESFIDGEAHKIGIFLSLFDVHINRAPVEGKVKFIKYEKGKFFSAAKPVSSRVNENNSIAIESETCPTLVKQIAGVIARRIVCDLSDGQEVKKGEKFGMIKFGSRTELYLPTSANLKIMVKVGDKVKAGETVIAKVQE